MRRSAAPRSTISIHLARRRYAAGDVVAALVDGVTGPARVALVRVERRPGAERAIVVDEQRLGEPYGVLELMLPRDALPTATGTGCSLAYAVEVRDQDVIARTALAVSAEARLHVAQGSAGGDLLVAGWDARHFHLELADASLRGGGWIAGRIHRHGPWCSSAIAVHAGCDECWCPGGPPARGMPYWQTRVLWSAEDVIALDPGARWVPFSFRLPPGLPPAIEARTIAWRYELRARRRRAHRRDETAALTPLLYDEHVPAHR